MLLRYRHTLVLVFDKHFPEESYSAALKSTLEVLTIEESPENVT